MGGYKSRGRGDRRYISKQQEKTVAKMRERDEGNAIEMAWKALSQKTSHRKSSRSGENGRRSVVILQETLLPGMESGLDKTSSSSSTSTLPLREAFVELGRDLITVALDGTCETIGSTSSRTPIGRRTMIS